MLSAPAAGQGEDDSLVVSHHGELITGDGRPLGGIYELAFRLYPDADTREELWNESHFVAVVNGQYELLLGETTEISSDLRGQDVFLSVEFQGQAVQSQRIRESVQTLAELMPPPTALPTLGFGGLPVDLTGVTFAQVADRALVAVEAEHAMDSDRLAGVPAAEILDNFDQLIDEIAGHERDPSAHGGGRRPSVGSTTRILQRVGGEGGDSYTRLCPAGYVMVGLQGRAGGFVDSLQVVCAPLE
jgi:hypothetical protein